MIRKIVIILLGIYILCLVGIYFFQENIIFRSKKIDQDYQYSFKNNFEEVNLKTSDGARINALHFKTQNPKGVILYFHGNKGNLVRWEKKIQPLLKYNYNLFMIDYRGYGKSTGGRTEQRLYDDSQLAYDYLLEQYAENQIIVYGRSLGGTFATYVASKNKPKKLILEATFSSIIDVSKSILPIFPFSKLYNFQFESYKLIPKVNVSTTIFHGNQDSLVPIYIAEKLYANSNKENTTLIKIENGTHHNLGEFEIYKNNLQKLLQ